MKTVIAGLFLCFFLPSEFCKAQSPQGISYQAVARDTAGSLISNRTIGVQFSIRDGGMSAPVVYQELHNPTTSELGLFQVVLGQGSVLSGTFSAINWSSNAKFLQVELDADGFGLFTDMGTQQLMSVPYALYAEKSGGAAGAVAYAGSWDASSNIPALLSAAGNKGDYYVVSVGGSTDLDGITDWQAGDWAIYNGTTWEKVDNSQSPVGADEVSVMPGTVLSNNVQDAIDELANSKVNRNGDTMTGDLILNADPVTALGAATKQYVDTLHTTLISSYIHRTDDGVFIYESSAGKRFGIGDPTPEAPLGISATGTDKRLISMSSMNGGNNDNWILGLYAAGNDSGGLNIQDFSSGSSVSRLFIDKTTGYVGLGMINPVKKMHLWEAINDGSTGLMIQNTASSLTQGWSLGHLHDSASQKRNGALDVSFGNGLPTTDVTDVRLTILPGGNVGINEPLPYTTLHVSKPASDPQTVVSLAENSGIAVMGPITDNIVFDYRGIQARHGEYIGPVLDLQTASLNLQRLGGDILIHGDTSISDDEKMVITNAGNLGLGVLTPIEKMELSGKFIVGNDRPELSGSSYAGQITNSAQAAGATGNRVGLKLDCNGSWGGDPNSKDIGLYVSHVGGQNNNANLAAVLNGNTVIGNVSADDVVGTNGTNVLAIQNGVAPAGPAGNAAMPDGGVQLFSASDVSGISVINVMNGDGTIIRFYRQAALSPANNAPINPTYDPTVIDILNNMRNRINELEAKLQGLGLLN